MLRFRNLGSGSGGNATVIEAFSERRVSRVLVDAGFTLKQLEQRLAMAGLSTRDLDAAFVTHEHGDHIGCARELALRDGLAIWMSHGTHLAWGAPSLDGRLNLACDGEPVTVGDLQLLPFTVPHDAREPLQLSVTDGDRRMGILTDLGHVTEHVIEHLAGCSSLMMECNHDAELLSGSNYPPALKRRVGGRHGHLSNAAAAQAMARLAHKGLGVVVAAHLSAQNNRPSLAREALGAALGREPSDVVVADQSLGTDWIPA